jgi:hypothetical protein
VLLRLFITLATASLLSAQEPPVPLRPLQATRTVYLLPVPGGFDQYLASQLARQGVFEVVIDPALADAVLTTYIGKSFEEKLKELYPEPEPEPAGGQPEGQTQDAAQREYRTFQQGSSFARGRGNVFLVDPRSRRVLWSAYVLPKNNTPAGLDKAAREVVKRLSGDLKKAAQPGH